MYVAFRAAASDCDPYEVAELFQLGAILIAFSCCDAPAANPK